jgi:hypothetical protein
MVSSIVGKHNEAWQGGCFEYVPFFSGTAWAATDALGRQCSLDSRQHVQADTVEGTWWRLLLVAIGRLWCCRGYCLKRAPVLVRCVLCSCVFCCKCVVHLLPRKEGVTISNVLHWWWLAWSAREGLCKCMPGWLCWYCTFGVPCCAVRPTAGITFCTHGLRGHNWGTWYCAVLYCA